ncbi:E3 ubiquitin-protein ligase TRIM47-like isoform X2 [Antennarius striatus]|uniref:E3 ubiquitin-protein ligase TRIM47-like isoform X2 n=1 Tax=Antennarius striatus TaxID=241820 RepID=UPI0035B4480E
MRSVDKRAGRGSPSRQETDALVSGRTRAGRDFIVPLLTVTPHSVVCMQKRFDLMSEPPKCCICLDEFTNPASLPCGHCFCLGCIGEYWRIHGAYQCPVCKEFFPSRPQLKTDQTLHAGGAQDAMIPLKSGEVTCDFCPAKQRAVKSCLRCMASFCATHLEPHYRNEDLGRHHLVSVVKNLEESVCGLHGKQLNRFCRSDQTCICSMCAQTEHRGHRIMSISMEARKKKDKLKQRAMKFQQVIRELLKKVEKIKLSSDTSGEDEAWTQNKEVVRQLEEEISELQRKTCELQQLSQTEDNLLFLQRFRHAASS